MLTYLIGIYSTQKDRYAVSIDRTLSKLNDHWEYSHLWPVVTQNLLESVATLRTEDLILC